MAKGDKDRSQGRLVAETFDKKARGYAEGYVGASSAAHSFTVRRRRVVELLGGRGGKVLDVGCGPGVMVEEAISRGYEFYGVDISSEMINECAKNFGHIASAHFSVGMIERLDFPDSFFDVVLCVGVVEYLEDDRSAVKEMARVVKPGGLVVVTLPNRRSPYRVWQRIGYEGARRLVNAVSGRARTRDEVVHREYSEKGCRSLLALHQLMVTDVVYYNFKVMLFPLDRMFPGLSVRISRRLECLCRGGLRWLGTGFIVKAEKML